MEPDEGHWRGGTKNWRGLEERTSLRMETSSRSGAGRVCPEWQSRKEGKVGHCGVLVFLCIYCTNKTATIEIRGEKIKQPQSFPLNTSDVSIFPSPFPGPSDIYATMFCCTKHSRAWLWTQLFPPSLTNEHASMLLHKLHWFNSCTTHHWRLSSMPPRTDELHSFLTLAWALMWFNRFTHLFNTDLHGIFFFFFFFWFYLFIYF